MTIVASFYATWLDLDQTVLYSDQVETTLFDKELQIPGLPFLKTPINDVELIKNKTLNLFIWARPTGLEANADRVWTIIG